MILKSNSKSAKHLIILNWKIDHSIIYKHENQDEGW